MKLATWAEGCITDLKDHNFVQYKGHEFYRLNGDIFQSISFQGRKRDIYIWYNTLPLSMPDFWPNSGWGSGSGRLPEKDGELSANNEKEANSIKKKLATLLRNDVLPHLNSMENPDSLESVYDDLDLPGTGYPKAICNFLIGRYNEGRNYMKRYIKFCGDHSNVTTPLCNELLSLDNIGIKAKLEEYRTKNFRKYRLAKAEVKK